LVASKSKSKAMKVYVQSKSGDHNSILQACSSVEDEMRMARRLGYYLDDKGYVVPFEEIQYMKEEKE